MQISLPYFDLIFSRLEAQDARFEAVFSRHVHFGYWPNPDHQNTYRDKIDGVRAMDRLCQLLIELSDIQNGQNVLDVGCGFGGTLATINDQFSEMNLTGVNIDPRQIEQARKRWSARPTNQLQFLVGDACEIDFQTVSFDRITAVECIFHFLSRRKFFERVRRCLRKGGNLTITDFVQPEGVAVGLWDKLGENLWGRHAATNLSSYRALAAKYGMKVTSCQDISPNVRPTYHFLGSVLGAHFPQILDDIKGGEFLLDNEQVAYCALRFDRID
jgi:cyclopropane fatty-acyl-phospholipid synthase-like methyltransferase